ncbi:transporter substrate-binding domain-containing protein [Roseomonas sp. CCTCC AB2023176]|uniref:transporter substrate-binding domain-containing protein n=1 Tax=Roseomonas sp. CCTCC AB2023176 TaxID=3342640 RepID=UPI0035E2AA78
MDMLRNGLRGAALAAGLCFGAAAQPATAPGGESAALDGVRQRGTVRCAVMGNLPGFSAPDAAGQMRGMDADFCRAVASAALGDARKVTFEPAATPEDAIRMLIDGRVDIAARNITITYSRDANFAVTPAGVLLFDGQGFLARRDSGVTSARQLDGKVVCAAGGGGVLADGLVRSWATANGLNIAVVTLPSSADVTAALRENRCDAASADQSALAARRVTEFDRPDDYVLLPEIISREPLGPLVRSDAGRWREVVTWTLQALIAAEEYGIASTGVDPTASPGNPEVAMLTGIVPGAGAALGLEADWARQAVLQVGNYGEIFDRNLGRRSPIGLGRGLNDLWRAGGLMYPLPLR